MKRPRDLIESCSEWWDVDPAMVRGPGKASGLAARARHGAAWALRESGLSVMECGEALLLNHSSVGYLLAKDRPSWIDELEVLA